MTWMADRVLGFDLESLSAEPLTTLPCSFALVAMDFEKVVRVRHGLINPDCEIPEESTKIHGITTAMVLERGGTLEASVKGIAQSIDESVRMGIPIVGSNCVFDLTIINECHRRLFGEPWITQDWPGRVIDVLVLDRHCDRYRKGSRKLLALCAHYGVSLTNAHSAAADAEAAVRVAIAIGRKYPEVGMATVDDLHVSQMGWRKEWAESFSAYRVSKGEPPLGPEECDWPVMGLRKVAL